MAIKSIYSPRDFRMKLDNYPYPFNEEDAFSTQEGHASKYTTAGLGAVGISCKVHPVTLEAVNKYIISKFLSADIGFGGTAYNTDHSIVIAEYYINSIPMNPFSFIKLIEEGKAEKNLLEAPRIVVFYNEMTGKVFGSVAESMSPLQLKPYILPTGKKTAKSKDNEIGSEGLLFAAIRHCEDTSPEFQELLMQIQDGYKKMLDTVPDEVSCKELINQFAELSDMLYRKIVNYDLVEAEFPGEGVKFDIASSNIPIITETMIDRMELDDASVHGGLAIFSGNDETTKAVRKKEKSLAIKDSRGIYAPSERALSPSEENLVPVISSHYDIPDEIQRVGRHIHELSDFRNFLFRGPAGTGKTEGVKMLAYLMNRPYYFVTCSADTEVYDLTMQVIPDVQDAEGEKISIDKMLESLPNSFEIGLNPSESYKRITGEEKPDATEQDCVYAISQQLMKQLKEQKASFKYVDSPLITAIRTGGVCEIQEPNVIMKPGVLVGLNALFDKTATIQLMSGEQIKRHPDTVIVMTTNSSYEGVRPMNQSVISRMNMVVDFSLPTDAQLASRVMKESEYPNKEDIKKMIKVMHAMEETCERNGVYDGSLGVRELISWAKSAKLTGDIYQSAMYTIIGSATSELEVQEQLKHCLETQFSPQ